MADEQKLAPELEEPAVSGVAAHGGDPMPWTLAVVGVVSIVLTLVLIISLRAMFQRAQDAENYVKNVLPPVQALNDLLDKQQTALHSARWLDPAQGVVSLPIERAMALTVQELNGTLQPEPAAKPTADAETETQSGNPAPRAGETR